MVPLLAKLLSMRKWVKRFSTLNFVNWHVWRAEYKKIWALLNLFCSTFWHWWIKTWSDKSSTELRFFCVLALQTCQFTYFKIQKRFTHFLIDSNFARSGPFLIRNLQATKTNSSSMCQFSEIWLSKFHRVWVEGLRLQALMFWKHRALKTFLCPSWFLKRRKPQRGSCRIKRNFLVSCVQSNESSSMNVCKKSFGCGEPDTLILWAGIRWIQRELWDHTWGRRNF